MHYSSSVRVDTIASLIFCTCDVNHFKCALFFFPPISLKDSRSVVIFAMHHGHISYLCSTPLYIPCSAFRFFEPKTPYLQYIH